jgi:hypothetical protein
MALTIVCVRSLRGDEKVDVTIFISAEYLPFKERDSEGNVLPDQEWRHPDPTTLRYTEVGVLGAPERIAFLLQLVIDNGIKAAGGHFRVIKDGGEELLKGRLQSWDERRAQEEAEEAQRQAIEWQRDESVRGYCARCECQRDMCKGPAHRGQNRCMVCNGGEIDTKNHTCANCADLPYREMREKATGTDIEYAGEAEEAEIED